MESLFLIAGVILAYILVVIWAVIMESNKQKYIQDLDDLDMLIDRDRYDFLPTEKEKKEKVHQEQCLHILDSILKSYEMERFKLYIQKGIDLPYQQMFPDSVTIPIECKSILISRIEQSFIHQADGSNITYLRTHPSG